MELVRKFFLATGGIDGRDHGECDDRLRRVSDGQGGTDTGTGHSERDAAQCDVQSRIGKQAPGSGTYFRKDAHAFYKNPAWRYGYSGTITL